MNPPDINIDWFLENRDLVRFEVRASCGDQQNSINFRIRLSLLSPIDRRQLDPLLNREESTNNSTVAELLHISICQQHPEFSNQDREAELRKLLSSCWLVPSIKETAVQLEGRKILWRNGYNNEFEKSTVVRRFSELYQSQQIAARNLNFGTPKLKTASPAEAEELELLFCELRHSNIDEALRNHDSLINRISRGPKDKAALDRAIAKAIVDQKKPASFWFALKYQIVCSWTHAFLWGFRNNERPDVLFYFCGMPGRPMSEKELAQIGREQIPAEQRQLPVSPGAVRKAIKEQGLLGYADFPEDYPKAPFRLKREGHGDQQQVWIDFSALEEFQSTGTEEE
jgi:hypothetical protein